MAQTRIENPILNSPFAEPHRHFRFGNDGITNQIVEERRRSSYFVPIAKSRIRGKTGQAQLVFETEWTAERIKENDLINDIRDRVDLWRRGGYVGITKTTRRLLEYWTTSERERRLFFCQVEALETIVYLTEVAKKYGDAWIENKLVEANAATNSGLYRVALKMATGSGKTVVMAMLIAWHTLNKRANPQAREFADAFLVVAPGITIRDRLRVLLPSDPNNYYGALDLVPPDLMDELGTAKVVITNFHAFQRRSQIGAGKLTKQVLASGDAERFLETPGQMVRRVCRELGAKKNAVVINDEAHHCYRSRPDDLPPALGDVLPAAAGDKLTGEDRKEAETREAEARIWITGLEAVKAKLGVRAVYDLSATPFFLRGSGYGEGTLFPWVVSDFSLIDAIEAGIVKVPRLPVADDAMTGDSPTYRELWLRIRDDLPKKRQLVEVGRAPTLPKELEGALHTLYGNYERAFRQWEQHAERDGTTPPVFIVVCNNTAVSKMVFDYVAGYDRILPDGSTIPVPGELKLFSNVDGDRWLARPNAILVDSRQLESGEAMSTDFKKAAAREIEEFKAEYRRRFPGRDTDDLTDEDLLREVMNTVGKLGKLGEGVRCVVSVSMLTEGWDANTVTHILGVRAFGTQLLCEQVVGRGLRRMSYVANDDGMFEPEYAEVYGVPFSFIPAAGATVDPPPRPPVTRVRALSERAHLEIAFPRVVGYRYELPAETLTVRTFGPDAAMTLSPEDVPTTVENAPIVGEVAIHTLADLRARREQEVVFRMAKRTLERKFQGDGDPRPWLFPSLLAITKRWLAECVHCKDNAFPQLLLMTELADQAAERIYQAVVEDSIGEKRLLPVLRSYDEVGSTRSVAFDTLKPVYITDPAKCHVSHVVLDSQWEATLARTLERMPEVVSFVKNQGLGFTIPYVFEGNERNYVPDFIVRIENGHGPDDLLNLIIEVSGRDLKDKAEKVRTARHLWVPAVNHHGGFGRWAYIEVTDPWNAATAIRDTVAGTVALVASGRE